MGRRTFENSLQKPGGALPVQEAVAKVKSFKGPKFDQTVELSMHLNIDPKQADQQIRGAVALPNGIGKSKRVVAFCQGDAVKEALGAGAIKAGGEELVAEIEKGFFDFDVAVATPDMMRVISKLGRVLGPKGLMPSPKAGTVTPNVADAVKEYAAGKVEYRNDKSGNINAGVGKMSFSAEDLSANVEHFIQTIMRLRPTTTKGAFIRKITISGTMTPGVQIAHTEGAE
ncbi:MAG: 50S ribosomal protein L1 [Phycisphaeraceae bacterium]|nr:50S ribosomal protein L1 [Phycisphaeraceae bacterium]